MFVRRAGALARMRTYSLQLGGRVTGSRAGLRLARASNPVAGPWQSQDQGLKLRDLEELTAVKRDSVSSQVHSQFGMF